MNYQSTEHQLCGCEVTISLVVVTCHKLNGKPA